jgi:hypothetical protein
MELLIVMIVVAIWGVAISDYPYKKRRTNRY